MTRDAIASDCSLCYNEVARKRMVRQSTISQIMSRGVT